MPAPIANEYTLDEARAMGNDRGHQLLECQVQKLKEREGRKAAKDLLGDYVDAAMDPAKLDEPTPKPQVYFMKHADVSCTPEETDKYPTGLDL